MTILPEKVYIVTKNFTEGIEAVYSNQHGAKAHLKAEPDTAVEVFDLKDVYLGRDDRRPVAATPSRSFTIHAPNGHQLGKSYISRGLAASAARRLSSAKLHQYVEVQQGTLKILRIWTEDGRAEELR